MLEKLRKYPFNTTFVAWAPEDPGIYVLWKDDEVLYIGRADGRNLTIRSRLADHLSGRLGACSRSATHYAWELSMHPALRESELIADYRERRGGLPRCNAQAA